MYRDTPAGPSGERNSPSATAVPAVPSTALVAYCRAHGYRPSRTLAGGAGDPVWFARDDDGMPVVLKTAVARRDALASEAAWLDRHESAPRVLDVDVERGILALEWVPSRALVDQLELITPEREQAWLEAARRASGPVHPSDGDVRDRYARAFADVRSRPVGRPWDEAGLVEWFAWAAELDDSGWLSVGMDVITKNTLVDATGRWWAIDPMCARAPAPVVWCPWTIDRPRKQYGTDWPIMRDAQVALLETCFDADTAAAWMPGAMIWTLWWCPTSSPRHGLTLDGIEFWLAQWRQLV